ncbi:MAG: hypothetical protein KGJ78_01105 [Alphaproteobacteria bacterium]|nr:hypothetical protein [Alphaproteobacteria bacterium]
MIEARDTACPLPTGENMLAEASPSKAGFSGAAMVANETLLEPIQRFQDELLLAAHPRPH